MRRDTHTGFHKSRRTDTSFVVGIRRENEKLLEKKERNAATVAWVKGIRAHTGMTQEAFAERLGVARSMVARWETGVEAPNSVNTRKIASQANEKQASGVLRTRDDRVPPPGEIDTMEAALVGLFRQLGPADQARVLGFAGERVSARAATGDTSSQVRAAHRKG